MSKRTKHAPKGTVFINYVPREIVKHMSLASLAMDGRGCVSSVTHICNEECEGKHPDSVR